MPFSLVPAGAAGAVSYLTACTGCRGTHVGVAINPEAPELAVPYGYVPLLSFSLPCASLWAKSTFVTVTVTLEMPLLWCLGC